MVVGIAVLFLTGDVGRAGRIWGKGGRDHVMDSLARYSTLQCHRELHRELQ